MPRFGDGEIYYSIQQISKGLCGFWYVRRILTECQTENKRVEHHGMPTGHKQCQLLKQLSHLMRAQILPAILIPSILD